MELIDYTNKWLAGEIFEDLAMVIAGIIVFILALLAWRLGSSESARAIVWPLIVAAVLLIGLGGSLAYNNHARKAQYAQQYQENPQQFLDSEKARVDEFMKIYPQTIIVSAVMMVVAICLFAFFSTPWVRATGLTLIYRVLGRKITYTLIAQAEYRADGGYQPLIADFPEVASVAADETRHGDMVSGLLKKEII